MVASSPFAELERRSPGSAATTLACIAELGPGPWELAIDLGAGTGVAAGLVHQALGCSVVALDTDLQAATFAKTRPGVMGVAGSMTALPFAPGSVDLAICEGAIYVCGFEAGMRGIAHLLRPGGAAIVSDLVWNEGPRDAELHAFWSAAYPEMTTAAERVRTLGDLGFDVLAQVTLTEADWFAGYYSPIEAWLSSADEVSRDRFSDLGVEISLRRRFAAQYDYVAFVVKLV